MRIIFIYFSFFCTFSSFIVALEEEVNYSWGDCRSLTISADYFGRVVWARNVGTLSSYLTDRWHFVFAYIRCSTECSPTEETTIFFLWNMKRGAQVISFCIELASRQRRREWMGRRTTLFYTINNCDRF